MSTVDIITLAVIMITALIGAVSGFGKGLRFFSRGWLGRIVSIIICYFIFGLVLKIPFVENLLAKFVASLDETKWYLKILKYIRIDLIVFALVLFFAVQLVKKLVVSLIERVFEINNVVMRVINKVLGVAIYLFLLLLLVLIVFQIAYYISGADGAFYKTFQGSLFGLDKIYLDNPLNSVIESIRSAFANGDGESAAIALAGY